MRKLRWWFPCTGALMIILILFLLSSCVYTDVPSVDLSENETDKIIIRYSSFLLDSAQAGEVYHAAVAEFESMYPHILIDRDFIPNTNYTAGIKTRLLGGEKLWMYSMPGRPVCSKSSASSVRMSIWI